MTDVMDLMDSAQAARYIDEGLRERGLNGWKNPISSLGVAVKKNQIRPFAMPGANGLKRVTKRYFHREACDKLIAGYRSPGNPAVDFSPIIDRLGQAPDTELALEVGVSTRTVTRERERCGIGTYRE